MKSTIVQNCIARLHVYGLVSLLYVGKDIGSLICNVGLGAAAAAAGGGTATGATDGAPQEEEKKEEKKEESEEESDDDMGFGN